MLQTVLNLHLFVKVTSILMKVLTNFPFDFKKSNCTIINLGLLNSHSRTMISYFFHIEIISGAIGSNTISRETKLRKLLLLV